MLYTSTHNTCCIQAQIIDVYQIDVVPFTKQASSQTFQTSLWNADVDTKSVL